MNKIRVYVPFLALVLLVASAPFAAAQGVSYFSNGRLTAGEAPAGGLSCHIETEAAAPTTTVYDSAPGDIPAYWVVLVSGANWTTATIKISLKNNGLPEKLITLKYNIPGGTSGNVRTPFALTFWGGAYSENGNGVVTIITDVGTTTCTFHYYPHP